MADRSFKHLFLQQSYLDGYETYGLSVRGKIACWDYVVLTASNEDQAKGYRAQIAERRAAGVLPAGTEFLVIPDPDGKRCGSGGATLAVLRTIAEREGTEDLSRFRILCVHSGGDSKRVPQYSACGKIFSPVPRLLADGRRSTLFDEFLIGMAGIPSRIASGLLVCSGDVLLLFNPLQLDFFGEGAAALSIKECVETGKNHGVFLGGADGFVKRCLQKQSVAVLTDVGAVDRNGNVDIDTGAVLMSGGMVNALYSLVDTDEKYAAMVNDHVRLSFYADFLYPLAEDSTLEGFYRETPEGDFSPELSAARTVVFHTLRQFRMKLVRFSPASFLHFGTTGELLKLMTDDMPSYRFLGWSGVVNSNYRGSAFAAYNSYVSQNAVVGEGSYLEDADVHRGTVIGKGCVISGVALQGVTVPDHTVIHGLKLKDGRFVCRMYGVGDNPKKNVFMGKELALSLWETPLYRPCATMDEAVMSTINGNFSGELLSLRESFNEADVTAILPWQMKLNDKVIAQTILEAVETGCPADDLKKKFPFGISERVERYLIAESDRLNADDLAEFSRKIRIDYYASKLIDRDKMQGRCFDTIRSALIRSAIDRVDQNTEHRIVKDEVITALPVRVNFGGGWSDTPPYCLEHGGTVLNAAISLDGVLPIEVTVRKRQDDKIVLASSDIGSYREFDEVESLQKCDDPTDAFALHKAALLVCGVVPMSGNKPMKELCQSLGGGIYLNTRVIHIPKGSGLGTSSILAGACVKAIMEFLGENAAEDILYDRVLCMEQLMSTGGGWQDQVGGLAPGVKLVTSRAGLAQHIEVSRVNLYPETVDELDKRLVLIYTGQRRLARNLLREVVGKYISAVPGNESILDAIQRLAVLMRFELERGRLDRFAELMNEHWKLSKELDAGCTNTCIDQIFVAVEDLTDGRMICGAGGGGFLQVMLKKGVSVAMLEERLNDVFADSGVSVRTCKLIF